MALAVGLVVPGLMFAINATAFALSLSAPAASTTPSRARPVTLVTAKVKTADGLKLWLDAHRPATLDNMLLGTTGTGPETTESDSYLFRNVTWRHVKSDLSSAQLSGKFVDGYGSIRMTFTATQPATSLPAPKDCRRGRHPGTGRKGELKGSYELKADKVGKITFSSFPATLEIPPRCLPGPGIFNYTELSGRYTSPSGRKEGVFAYEPRGSSSVLEEIYTHFCSQGSKRFCFNHKLTVRAPNSDYSFSSDLSSASLEGAGALTGTANYSGTAVAPGGGTSTGKLTGEFSGTFATIGNVDPIADGGGSITASQILSVF
jgi:hypothetical protein